ncbi:MAG: hypothetical protein ACXWLM_11720 [Myxococcales bacterium]
MEARKVALALVVAAAAVALAHALWVSSVTDDAGISLAYARTFAAGQGLRLTPLSPRVEGYSDPLWVLWLALGYALHLPGPAFARISGALCAAAAVLLVGLLPSRALGRPMQPFDAVAPSLLALDTTYAFWAGSGLETGAFALALSAAMLLLARGSFWSAIPAALLCVLRPEGPLYVAGLAAFRFFSREARADSSPAAVGVGGVLSRGSDIVRWLALAALPALAWLALRRGYYAAWLPNAFFAKKRWDYGGFWYLNAWFLDDLWHWALYLAPLALVARSTRRAALLALPGCAAAVAFIFYSRGDWMSEHRFAAHALPAAALAAGLVPAALHEHFGHRDRDAGWLSACALVLLAALSTRARSPDRRRSPELPLSYIAEQGRWFRRTADRLGLVRPRVAHFDIGGLALESGGEVIDLAGLADLYIGRVGYQSHAAVRDYLFDEVRPEMLNLHGPCQYLHDDPRLQRDYLLLATSGAWGENWVRKSLELDGLDDRCPPKLPKDLLPALERSTAVAARDLWLCARAHLPAKALPDVSALAKKLANEGTRASLDAAVTLDPTLAGAANRLLALRLSGDVRPRR